MEECKLATLQADEPNAKGHEEEINCAVMDLPTTQEEFGKLLQIEGDRRVSQALKTVNEKWQQKLIRLMEAEKIEAQRLAKRSAEQAEKEILEKYGMEIEMRERALIQKELEIKTIEMLLERKLPVEFKEFVMDSDEAIIQQRVDCFDRVWKQKLEEAARQHSVG